MPLYTDNNSIFKTNINLCLDIDLNYRLLDTNTNKYKIINTKNLSIYNNTITIDYLHASGGTYTTASAESWILPKNLYGYDGISPCWGDQPNIKYDNYDWVEKGTNKIANILKQKDYTYCTDINDLQVDNIKSSGARVLRLGAVPYFLFKDMYELDKRLNLNNITENMKSYIAIINTYCNNNIYCIVDPFHSDSYNLCSINNPILVQDIFYPDRSIKKNSMTNKWEPLTSRQFINAWSIIVKLLKEKISPKYQKYLLLELCNEPGGEAESSNEDIESSVGNIIKGCNSIIGCNMGSGNGGDNQTFNSNKNCQDIYDNSYQIPTIKAIRQIIPNIPIIVATYNTWTGGAYTFGSNIPNNWYPYNCGKGKCTPDNYMKDCIPTHYNTDGDLVGCGLGMIFSLLNNLKSHNLVGQPHNNIILAIHQYADTDIINYGQSQYIIDTYDKYLSPLNMKWFITEGNFNNYDSNSTKCYVKYLESMKNSTSFLGYTLFLNYYNFINDNHNSKIFFYDDNNNLKRYGSFKTLGDCPKTNPV